MAKKTTDEPEVETTETKATPKTTFTSYMVATICDRPPNGWDDTGYRFATQDEATAFAANTDYSDGLVRQVQVFGTQDGVNASYMAGLLTRLYLNDQGELAPA